MTTDAPQAKIPTFEEWRPNDHPVELSWPPVRPSNDEDVSFLYRSPEVCPDRPFSEFAARSSFGDVYMFRLSDTHPKFTGDRWLLAFLSRVHEYAREVDFECKHPNRFAAWNQLRFEMKQRGEWCYLNHVHLAQWNLSHIDLSGAVLEHAVIRRCALSFAKFDEASLRSANFYGSMGGRVSFKSVDGRDSWLAYTILRESDFRDANLSQSRLNFSHLHDSAFKNTELTGADLRGTKELLFDECAVRSIKIGKPNDDWSRLRSAYTGPWFFVHAMLLGLFLAPYVAKVIALTAAGEVWLLLESRGLAGTEANVREEWAWKVLTGLHDGFWVPLIGGILLVYNALGGYLTLQVGVLRDAEERSGVSPALEEYRGCQGTRAERGLVFLPRLLGAAFRAPFAHRTVSGGQYIGLVRVHRLLRLLMWIALASFGYHAVNWVTTTKVPMPGTLNTPSVEHAK